MGSHQSQGIQSLGVAGALQHIPELEDLGLLDVGQMAGVAFLVLGSDNGIVKVIVSIAKRVALLAQKVGDEHHGGTAMS